VDHGKGIEMEDLVPFLIFIVIALVNMVKFIMEKGLRGKQPPARPGEPPPKHQPSTLEEFFEEIAGKLEPQPTEPPEWPKGFERPDYMKEMEEFEMTRAEELEEETLKPVLNEPLSSPSSIQNAKADGIQGFHAVGQSTSLQSTLKSIPSAIIGTKGMQIKTAPILRSSIGRIDYSLKNKADLKKAIIANIIFSPPRAYNCSFENTTTR
jgi:hypothetical protein